MSRMIDPRESERPVGQPNNGKTILLAEDDPFISRMYQTKLEGAGYAVRRVSNGRDAYEQIKQALPDLIMLDINMPELSGFEVIRALLADTAIDLKTVMVLTNSANPADRKTAADLGVEYLIKAELTPRDVLTRINTKLGIAD